VTAKLAYLYPGLQGVPTVLCAMETSPAAKAEDIRNGHPLLKSQTLGFDYVSDYVMFQIWRFSLGFSLGFS
jgi:hypothetical protein